MNAPIALFVYNRPEHTLRVLQKLSENELANESSLYVFCDGAKESSSEEQRAQIDEVRRVVKSRQWCKEVVLRFEERNKGVNISLIEGITEVVNRHSKVIVLEDDILTSKYFLRFMNEALQKYENETSVMAVSGYWFPINAGRTDPFFLSTGVGWGWGTWGRAWSKYIRDNQYLIEEIEKNNEVSRFNRGGSYDFFGLLIANSKGLVSGWDVAWYACMFLNNGMALFPPASFTINIGVDGSGTHFSQASDQFSHPPGHLKEIDSSGYHIRFPESIVPDETAGNKMDAYLRKVTKTGFLQRLTAKFNKTIKSVK